MMAGVLIAAIATLLVWILTPERLTPLIADTASDYLTADVTLDRAELSFWSTFPHLEVDIDNLKVVSRSLDGLTEEQRQSLPECADSLLSVGGFHGGINVLRLLTGRIALYDLELRRCQVNLVAYNDSVANYLIFPPSEEEPDTSAVTVPNISVNRFVISEGMPVRYFSAADSIDVALTINATEIDGEDNPVYNLSFDAGTSASMQPYLSLLKLPIVVNGAIDWNHERPLCLALSDFNVGLGPVHSVIDTDLDMTDDFTVNDFSMDVRQFRIVDLINVLPPEYKNLFAGLKTDLTVGAKIKFTEPYIPSRADIPMARIDVTMPGGELSYQEFRVDRLAGDLTIHLNGPVIDRTVVDLNSLTATGYGMDFKLQARATRLESDPLLDGSFDGSASLARLPQVVMCQLPVTVSGELDGHIDFRFALSDLSLNRFHHLTLNGDATLRDLHLTYPEMSTQLYSRLIEMKLGTSDSYVRNNLSCDSMLTASIKCDTMAMDMPGMQVCASDLALGAGVKNSGALLDTTVVNPLGAVFRAHRLVYNAESDSMRVTIRDVNCSASLRRYNNDAKLPLLTFALDGERMAYRDDMNRLSFRRTRIDASCHPRLRPQMSQRMNERFDSISRLYPHLRPDSIYSLTLADAKRRRGAGGRRSSAYQGTETLDLTVDNTTRDFLKWIDFKASFSSERARFFTPYFPVRNRFTDIRMTLTPDSLVLHNTKYKMGSSDFTISGSIANISRALTSKRQPLSINLDIVSDTIEVNEIAEAALAGAAFADRVAQGERIHLSDTDNEELLQMQVEQAAASDSMAPIIVPINLQANIKLKANHIIYSDLTFHNFNGQLLVNDGAVSLHNMSASADMGDINLTALYTAPTKDDLSFAFGLQVHDLYLDKFLHLVPAVDSMMPLLRDVKGIINAEIAATSKIDSCMNLVIPSLSAALKITGDSLVLVDADTFRKIGKWLLFKRKDRNVIDHMSIQLIIEDSQLEIFPFKFDIDRYQLGIMGHNDMGLNYDYHISVLKSPIPFKFGINVRGNPDKMRIRLGRARYKDGMAMERVAIVDTTRINLIQQIERVFRNGVSRGRVAKLSPPRPDQSYRRDDEASDTISHADSLLFIQEGLIPAPPAPEPAPLPADDKSKKKKNKK